MPVTTFSAMIKAPNYMETNVKGTNYYAAAYNWSVTGTAYPTTSHKVTSATYTLGELYVGGVYSPLTQQTFNFYAGNTVVASWATDNLYYMHPVSFGATTGTYTTASSSPYYGISKLGVAGTNAGNTDALTVDDRCVFYLSVTWELYTPYTNTTLSGVKIDNSSSNITRDESSTQVLSWTSAGGTNNPITSHVYQYSTNGGSSWSGDITIGSATKSINITTPDAPGTLMYRVKSVGTYGSSAFVNSPLLTGQLIKSITIKTASGWVTGTPYVKTSGGWTKGVAYVKVSGGWTKGTG